MASLLGNTEMPSKLYTHVSANELFYNSKRLKISLCHYETFLNKSKVNNKVIALESTIALLNKKLVKILIVLLKPV